jgi:hypothetical protein
MGLAWGLAMAFAGPLLAAPLEKEVCNGLKEEREQLVVTGAKADMERGPEWAKSNLALDRIRQIERLIDVEEQLAFRCPQPKPPLERTEDLEPAAAAVGAPSSESEKRASPANAVRALRKAKAVSAARATGQAERRRTKKNPQRPKANDAFVPAPKSSDAYAPPSTASSLTWRRPPAQ